MGSGGIEKDECDKWKPSDLKTFQRVDIGINKLNKYDQFYRFVGQPFVRLGIKEFMMDLENMKEFITW